MFVPNGEGSVRWTGQHVVLFHVHALCSRGCATIAASVMHPLPVSSISRLCTKGGDVTLGETFRIMHLFGAGIKEEGFDT